jgi:hypothetical protein
MRKIILYKNTYILKLLLNVVTAGEKLAKGLLARELSIEGRASYLRKMI